MSFETSALFSGSCLIKFKTSFLEINSKEKFWLPKFSFIFLQLCSFSKFIFPVDSRRLVIFVKYSLEVLEFFFFFFFLLPLRVSFFSVKIMLLVVLHLSVKNGLTVFPEFSVISYFICVWSLKKCLFS